MERRSVGYFRHANRATMHTEFLAARIDPGANLARAFVRTDNTSELDDTVHTGSEARR
jgi:hypothetical protein